MTTDYERSQDIIARAEAAMREGNDEEGRCLYREAAVLQQRAVEALPPERILTRGAYMVSAAALFYRADDLAEAERLVSAVRFVSTVLGSGTWGLSRTRAEELRALIAARRREIGGDGQPPQLFEGPSLDITGGVDPADYIEQQREEGEQ